MTESTNHRAPLAPGEIRTHTVGACTFRVMHVAGGSFTQASVREPGQPSKVLCTDRFEFVVVAAYVDAIEAAESVAADALDDADGVAFISSATGELIEPDADLTFNLPVGADMRLVSGENAAGVPSLAFRVHELRTLISWHVDEGRWRVAMLAHLEAIATALNA